jgi:ABC-2 type transport system permease protein
MTTITARPVHSVGRGPRTRLVAGRLARQALSDPGTALVFPTVVPLALVGILSQVYDRAADLPGFPGERFIDWMAPSMVIITPLLGAGWAGMSLVADLQGGYLARLQLAGVGRRHLLGGMVLFEGLRSLPSAAAVLGLGLTLGAPYRGGVAGLVLLFGLTALLAAAWSTLFIAVALTSRDRAAVQAVYPAFLPLWWTSTSLMPRDAMPGWMQTVTAWNPLTVLIDVGRASALDGTIRASSVAAASAVVIVGLGIGYVACDRLLADATTS